MSIKSKIEWTDSTWNPVTSCTPVSIGCEKCYAKRLAGRFPNVHAGNGNVRVMKSEGIPAKFNQIIFHPDRLDIPFHWRKPKRVFVCSMGDLFHEQVAYAYIGEVFSVIRDNPQHTFMILTKRPERIPDIFDYLDYGTPCGGVLPNLWLGVTTENQEMADKRIPILLQIPGSGVFGKQQAAKRFVSVEPMLGPVNLFDIKLQENYGIGWSNPLQGTHPKCPKQLPALDWVICGRETGPGARPMNLDWARSLRDQCVMADVPFFYKRGELDGKLWHQSPEVINENLNCL